MFGTDEHFNNCMWVGSYICMWVGSFIFDSLLSRWQPLVGLSALVFRRGLDIRNICIFG